MSSYLIPNYKIEDLQRKLERISNKGADITFNIIDDHVDVPAPSVGPDFSIECSRVEVDGEYKINGWNFVATIEHSSPENIIRIADRSFDGRIPEKYRTTGRECEHCHLVRDRNDTYLVYNEDSDEFKQVGKTCLRSYTGGLSASVCASLASVMTEINRITQEIYSGNFEDYEPEYKHYFVGYPMAEAKKKAYKYVVDNGYKSGETGKEFADKIFNNEHLASASDEEVHKVNQ